MSQQVPKMKPQFDLCKCIDGSRSLQKFSLKKYKHLSKLKIIKPPNAKFEQNSKRSLLLTKLSFSVKSLNLSQYCFLERYSRSQIKLIAKKLYKITRFSIYGSQNTPKTLFLAILVLKKAKSLRHICLKGGLNDPSSQHLFCLISQFKIKTLDLISISSSPDKSGWLLNFLNYLPSSVEELSLCWRNQMRPGSRLELSVNHLDNLQKLELGMPLCLETFTEIIKSIQDPSKLKTLRFHLEKSQKERSHLSDVQAFLGKCLNLEELNIQTDLDVYPNHLNLTKLKKLAVKSTGGLLRIVDFIQQQRDTLESLSLTSKLWSVFPKDGFLEGLKQLQKLKKFKLNIKLEASSVNAFDLAQLIEALECLEEMNVLDMSVHFSENSFEKFCRALEKRSGSLRSLKISFNNWSLNLKSLGFLSQTLILLSKLEDITFKDFALEDARFYCELREIICCKNRNLNEVFLQEKVKWEKVKVYRANLMKMLKEIIHKPTMKKFRYLEDGKEKFISVFKDVEILSLSEDVLQEVHHFYDLELPPWTCKPTFYSWELGWHKWLD